MPSSLLPVIQEVLPHQLTPSVLYITVRFAQSVLFDRSGLFGLFRRYFRSVPFFLLLHSHRPAQSVQFLRWLQLFPLVQSDRSLQFLLFRQLVPLVRSGPFGQFRP